MIISCKIHVKWYFIFYCKFRSSREIGFQSWKNIACYDQKYYEPSVRVQFVHLSSLPPTWGEHTTNHSSGKYWMNISSHSQTMRTVANMNHFKKAIHTAHEHPIVFMQKTDKFQFITSCLLTICICFINSSAFTNIWFTNCTQMV